MLDQEHGDVLRQRLDGREKFVALGLRHAGRRLVEQQDARLAGEGERHLEQALLAVGQDRGALAQHVGEAEAFRRLDDLVGDLRRLAADRPPPVGTQPLRSETTRPIVSSGSIERTAG